METNKKKKIVIIITLLCLVIIGVVVVLIITNKPKETTINPPVSTPVSEPVSLPIVSQTRLELLNPEKFAYGVLSNYQECEGPLDGYEVYTNTKGDSIMIHRKEINITTEATLKFNNAISIIKGEKTFEELNERNPLDAFRTFCSGFISFHTNGYKIDYPNVEAAIVVPAVNTQSPMQGIPEHINIEIMGLKSGDIFQIGFSLEGKVFFNDDDINKCQLMDGNNLQYDDLGCVINQFDTDLTKQNKLIEWAETEIIPKFEIKP